MSRSLYTASPSRGLLVHLSRELIEWIAVMAFIILLLTALGAIGRIESTSEQLESTSPAGTPYTDSGGSTR